MAKYERKRGATRKPRNAPAMPPSPLETMEYSGDPEVDSRREAALTLEALQNKERKKALRTKLRLMTDSEYWCALCFETREQKNAFLQAVGAFEEGDKYLDGVAMARRLEISLPASDMEYRPAARPNSRLNALVKD